MVIQAARPCWVEIDTRALEDNFRFLAHLAAPHAELLAIVKANAYGHGLAQCAPAAVRAGAAWLGVTSVEEAVEARGLCPTARILAIGSVFPGQGEAVVRHRITPVVWDPLQIDELELAAQEAGLDAGSLPVHLELDTGMSRQGADKDTLNAVLARFTAASPLRLEGVMTHLFASDEGDGRVTREQLQRLEEALERIAAAGHFADWLNVGSSSALLAGYAPAIAALAARHGMRALMRPGLVLYGLLPRFAPDFEGGEEPAPLTTARGALRPVLAWKSKIVSLRQVPAGAVVGYNGTFVATEPMRLALVAAGYADGLDRQLGNRFSLAVRGQRAPLVGRVSMDQSVIDVTDIPDAAPGDEVLLLGVQGEAAISAFDHAEVCGTICWEVFTRIGHRVTRHAL